VFPKYNSLLLSMISGTYWLAKENVKHLYEFIDIARKVDSEYIVLDVEVLPIWKNNPSKHELVNLIDEIHDNGIKAKVTTIPITPKPNKRMKIIKDSLNLLKKRFPNNKIGVDIGAGLSIFPVVDKLTLKLPRTLEEELKFCESLGVYEVSIYDLSSALVS